ncbi:MAG: ATP-binding protein [Candidatus Polarisedimenticolia bacterium]
MSVLRRLRYLNWGRIVAVTTLLVAAFMIELLFMPERPLRRLYFLAAAVYAAVAVYAALDRFFGDRPWLPAVNIAGDALLIGGFVVASGGALSPLSFLFALPVMVAAAVWGLRGGAFAAGGVWCLYGLIVLRDVLRLPSADLPPGRVIYAVVSHLIGLVLLGALGGALADRLRSASDEIERQRGTLADLTARHEQIVASINTGLLTTDPQGRTAFVNRAGLEILRCPAADVLGRSAAELLGLPPGFLEEARAMERAGKKARFERPWRRPGTGEELLLGFAAASLRAEAPDESGWLIVFQDLSEIASLEAQVRTRERMAALGEMAAGIAHELRNPLAAISGCVQMLAKGAAEDRRNLADVALRETERLNRIIRDFLEFARPGPFRPRACDPLALVEEMSRLLRKSPEIKRGQNIVVVDGPGRREALADPDRLRQVYWNLAGNALKAMPDGGTLTIEVAGYGGDHVQLAFRDEGPGMDEETLARLFQPFHGRFREGAGLGAAIVYRIAEEHGGKVQVVSRLGHGTEVRFIVPAAPRDEGKRDARGAEAES